jgi:lysophospholipase L1-like esterase
MHHLRTRRALAGLAIAGIGLLGTTSCEPAVEPDTYVALGDSAASGPLILPIDQTKVGCTRSLVNYPHLTAPRIRAERFVDVSCGGATLRSLTEWHGLPAPLEDNPPQLEALDERTKVISLTLGANDTGWTEVLTDCATRSITLTTCEQSYRQGGVDTIRARVLDLAPRYDDAFDLIKAKAPNAEIFLVGYPLMVPPSGPGCYPLIPALPSDVAWVRGLETALNDVMRSAAERNGAHFVDLKASSVGHDICSSARWVEGLVPFVDAAPFHANGAGHRHKAELLEAAIDRVVTE